MARTLTYISDTIAFDRGEYFGDQLGWGQVKPEMVCPRESANLGY
jgi:hypothetical protein